MAGETHDENGTERTLFGDPRGWRLAPVVAWLTTEGRRITEPSQLINQLCRRLVDAGAPVWRVRFSFQTIHPEVAGWIYTWRRGGGSAEEFRATHGIRESDRYLGSPIEQVHRTGRAVRHRLDRLDPERDHPVLHELAAAGGLDYVALPLVFSNGTINTFIVTTDTEAGFCDADIEKFEALSNFVVPIFEVITTRRIAASLLDTYVGRRTGSKVLRGLIKRGDGETIHAALWFSDLRDFTALSEHLPPQRLLATLNAYFEFVAAAVTARGGEILRFIGDAMLIVFPVDDDDRVDSACSAALDAALDAFNSLGTLNHRRQRMGEPPIHFGVGLHIGEVIYGNVGAPDRLDFTVMGPAVNRTARLEGLTKDLDVPLLMSEDFSRRISLPVRSLGRHEMKGVAEPQEVFALDEHASRDRSTSGAGPNIGAVSHTRAHT